MALAYFVIGRLRIAAGRSGIRVPRFNAFERFSHWLTAASFVLLALTGLNITFGKVLLLPLIGPDAFTALSEGAKYVHNFVSFPFVLGLVLIVAMWMKDNIPRKVDIDWLKEGGGFIQARSIRPPAASMPARRLVFWLALGAGAAVAISGYLLLFPFYVTNISGMQLAQVVHGIIAVLFIALIIGHIYIGTLGMEGAFEAMGTAASISIGPRSIMDFGSRRRSRRVECPTDLRGLRPNRLNNGLSDLAQWCSFAPSQITFRKWTSSNEALRRHARPQQTMWPFHPIPFRKRRPVLSTCALPHSEHRALCAEGGFCDERGSQDVVTLGEGDPSGLKPETLGGPRSMDIFL